MKTSLIVGIIIGIGIVITASGFLYQETYNQNCIAEGGKITGFLRCIVVFEDFADPLLSKYGVEYEELVTREVKGISQVAIEIIPERNCHKFSVDETKNLPENLKLDIEHSAEDLERVNDDDDEFLDRYAAEISFDEALSLLEKYDFHLTTKTVDGNTLPKIQDTAYVFECIFEDENNQYRIELEFESHYLGYGRLVFVNFTNNEQGIPIIENDNITLFTGGFNQTVVFQNKLDHEITLEMINRPPSEESSYSVPENIVIPPGKVWSHFFKKFGPEGDLVYQYNTKPDNLHGIVILKNHPPCMTENQVRSLYSEVEVYPKFPAYLPEGYSFDCGVHNFNSAVYLVYWTDELREKFDDKVNAAINMEFLAAGGLSIYYHNDFVLSNWIVNPNYDKFEKAKEKAEHPQATTLTIKDNPAVMVKQHFTKSGETISFNKLEVFSDNEIWYSIRSSLPESELIKIAESLFSEPEPTTVEKLLLQNQIDYVPSKLAVTGGPAFQGDPGCGAVIDSDLQTHWFEIDSISNPKIMTLYSENPNPCKINHTSCFCNAQMELTALTLDELSYLTSEQEQQIGKRVQKYFETIPHSISMNKFVVGKYNFNIGDQYMEICGALVTEYLVSDSSSSNTLHDGISIHNYFSGTMEGSRLWDFSLSVDNKKLCAISDDAKIFEYQKSEE